MPTKLRMKDAIQAFRNRYNSQGAGRIVVLDL
jgi:hypothetical protein